MKTNSSSAERSTRDRNFGIVDTLVLMLAAGLFAAWILGTLFVYLFPTQTSTSADSTTAALVGNADGSMNDSAVADVQGSNGTDADIAAGDAKLPNATSGVSNPNQLQASDGLAEKERTALERKISGLQKQLDTKSKELTELQKAAAKSAKPDPIAAVDTSKYEKQISQLKKEKGLLDREIKRLNDQSEAQETKIQTLEDQLADATQSNSMAATGGINAEANPLELGGAPPKNPPLEFRDWISSKGNKARLAFVRWEDDKIIVVNEDKKKFRLTLNRLSPEDQKYVNSKR